jgi:hypothetical protein
MRDPVERPILRLGEVILHLARHDVRWVLTGSVVLAACDVAIEPNDVDVTPELSRDNLCRLGRALEEIGAVPACTPGWAAGPAIDQCRAWRPAAAEASLDHLFVTDLGMIDVVPRLCGLYEELMPSAAIVEVGGVPLAVCEPLAVLARLDGLARRKDLERARVYAQLRDRSVLAVRVERLEQLAATRR